MQLVLLRVDGHAVLSFSRSWVKRIVTAWDPSKWDLMCFWHVVCCCIGMIIQLALLHQKHGKNAGCRLCLGCYCVTNHMLSAAKAEWE